jgi:hypothetical protein
VTTLYSFSSHSFPIVLILLSLCRTKMAKFPTEISGRVPMGLVDCFTSPHVCEQSFHQNLLNLLSKESTFCLSWWYTNSKIICIEVKGSATTVTLWQCFTKY